MFQKIVPLTKDFLSIPSISGDRKEIDKILAIVKRELQEFPFLSFESNGHPSLLYANRNLEKKEFDIILNAHLDIVHGKPEEFIPKEIDGKLYGRGAKDMKAASAVMVLLFKELAKTIPYSLALQIVTDEEPGGLDGTGYQVKQGVKGKFAICGEGTNLVIIHKAKTRMLVKLTTNGKTAHSAYPWKGENAVMNMHKAIANIFQAYPTPQEESEETIVTVTSFTTENNTLNQIPDNCTAYLDIRFVPDEQDSIIPKITSLLPENIIMEIVFKFYSHDTNPENIYLQLLQKEGEKLLGHSLKLGMAHGASDAPFFTEVGCDAIEFGPTGNNHHGEGEWVDIQSLEDYYHILKNFLLSAQDL